MPDEAIILFSRCEGFKWNFLPAPGGIRDQSPKLLDKWMIIFRERGIAEEERIQEQKRKSESMRGGKAMSRPRRGGRRGR